jgi:ribosome-associated protein
METDFIPINENLSLPAAELQFRFSTGGGPGGQHVNKTATRVTLLFDVANSPSLDEETRARLLNRLGTRLDRRGMLHIDVHDSRSQWQNRETAIARMQSVLAEALVEQPPRRPTRPSRQARETRLEEKRRRGDIKKERQQPFVVSNFSCVLRAVS